jgi:hypothetical protein
MRLSRPGKIVLGGLLWGALYLVIGLYFAQGIANGIDPKGFARSPVWGLVPAPIEVLFVSPYIGAFMAGTVLLFMRRFLNAICLIGIALSSYLPVYALDAIRGDRTGFTDGAHREIADIFHQRYRDFVSPGPRLVPLDDQCHPPNSCTRWVVWDPSYPSELEKDLGRWHRPKSSIFMFLPGQVPYRVDVKRLELQAYSVLACVDPSPFFK